MRSFSAHDFIQLPPLGEAGTLTLVEELAATARDVGKLSAGAHGALERLVDALAALKQHIATRERAGSTADPRARAADRALDDAWAAFQTWLLGWTYLPDRIHPRVPDAKNLYASIFPKGLQFLTLEFKDEWTESQKRLDAIAAHDLDELIDALGGWAFLENVVHAHRAYGDALQITADSRTPEPDALVRRALEETHMALRDYIAQVAAMVRRNDLAAVSIAGRLLAPISFRAIEEDEVTLASARDDLFPGGGGPP